MDVRAAAEVTRDNIDIDIDTTSSTANLTDV